MTWTYHKSYSRVVSGVVRSLRSFSGLFGVGWESVGWHTCWLWHTAWHKNTIYPSGSCNPSAHELAFTHNMAQEYNIPLRIMQSKCTHVGFYTKHGTETHNSSQFQVDVSIPQLITLSLIWAPNTQKSVLLHRRTGHTSATICVSADERQDSQDGEG